MCLWGFSTKLSWAPLCCEAFLLSQKSLGFYHICFNQRPSWETVWTPTGIYYLKAKWEGKMGCQQIKLKIRFFSLIKLKPKQHLKLFGSFVAKTWHSVPGSTEPISRARTLLSFPAYPTPCGAQACGPSRWNRGVLPTSVKGQAGIALFRSSEGGLGSAPGNQEVICSCLESCLPHILVSCTCQPCCEAVWSSWLRWCHLLLLSPQSSLCCL